MDRRAKPVKGKAQAKRPRARKSAKDDGAKVRDLETRLAEALDQQTATSEILRVISRSPTDVQPVFDTISESAQRLCGAGYSQVALYDGELLHMTAFHNISLEGVEALRRRFPTRADRGSAMGRAIQTRTVVHIPDVLEDPGFAFKSELTTIGSRSIIAAPMLRDGEPIGAIGVGRPEPGPFPDAQIRLLQTFADQAVIAIENVRLFTELQEKNRALTAAHAQVTEALDQQTATSEILRVISSSPTDLQPVFDTIVESVVQLCDGVSATVYRFDGQLIHLIAHHHSVTSAAREVFERVYPLAPSRTSVVAQAILDRAVIHIRDFDGDPAIPSASREMARAVGHRSLLAVPMLRGEDPIGAISVGRRGPRGAVRPFSDSEITLLQTFADQAVIAIENVRLFNETKEALDRQTATSEILGVISSSPTDVQPVFEAIVRSAAALCHASDALILVADGDSLRFGASVGPVAASVGRSQLIRERSLPLTRGSVSGRAVMEQRTVHIHDVSAMPDGEFPEAKRLQREYGGRGTTLAIPLLRDDVSLGVITLVRNEVRPFTDQQVALLETFADQAVIAIENVRLFRELQARNHDLTEALEQQTATGEILRVISSSPTDTQPVFDTIA